MVEASAGGFYPAMDSTLVAEWRCSGRWPRLSAAIPGWPIEQLATGRRVVRPSRSNG